MDIEKIFCFLVHPGKHDESQKEISSTVVQHSGNLFDMLNDIFQSSDNECDIPIKFNIKDGKQENEMRTLILQLMKNQKIENAKRIAQKLQEVTNKISGLGLLFIILGNSKAEKKVLLSRFPADQGITADIGTKGVLQVEFVEKIFMKNSRSYKACVYSGQTLEEKSSELWDGKAIDKQIGKDKKNLSDYWVFHFLMSDFKTSPKLGTRQLASYLSDTIAKTESPKIKQELVSSGILGFNLLGKTISLKEFGEKYLSEEARTELESNVNNDRVYDAKFVFDIDEYSKKFAYKSIELDNGGFLTADPQKFDKCFESKLINKEKQKFRFTTEGSIIDEKFKRRF